MEQEKIAIADLGVGNEQKKNKIDGEIRKRINQLFNNYKVREILKKR